MSSTAPSASSPLAKPSGTPRIPSYLLPSAGAALLLTALFYGVLFLFFRDTYFTVMFTERSAIPYMTAYLTFMALGLLLGSHLHLNLERKHFQGISGLLGAVESLDREAASGLREQLPGVAGHARGRGLVVSRVNRVLQRVETRGNASDVAAMLSEQAEIDRAVFSQSHSTVKFIAWLIPVLGFIGTVGGISFAIAKFPELFQAGAGSLQDNIGPVTGNLGVAFETTLMALVEIAIIIFFLYAVQKRGNELLNAFDEFCLDHLLGKVRGAGIAEDAGPFSDLARVLSDHVEHMEEKFEKAVGRVVEKMVENENERWTSFTESFRAVAKEHQEAVHSSCEWMTRESSRLAEELKAWDNKFRACIEEMVRDIGEIEKQRLDNLNSAVGRIEELLKSARELEALQQTLQANLAAIAETGDVRKAMDRLNESTEQLRPVLADLQKKRRMQVRIVDEVEE